LYRTGEFYDLTVDPFEQHLLPRDALTGEAKKSAVELQAVLDQFTNARPVELDLAFESASARKEKK
jgi:hypothetical protein